MPSTRWRRGWRKRPPRCTRVLGPGFTEGVYEQALDIELTLRGIPFLRQPSIPIVYRERIVGRARPDFLVSECVDQIA